MAYSLFVWVGEFPPFVGHRSIHPILQCLSSLLLLSGTHSAHTIWAHSMLSPRINYILIIFKGEIDNEFKIQCVTQFSSNLNDWCCASRWHNVADDAVSVVYIEHIATNSTNVCIHCVWRHISRLHRIIVGSVWRALLSLAMENRQ